VRVEIGAGSASGGSENELRDAYAHARMDNGLLTVAAGEAVVGAQ
jgi:hypothetical protein